MGCFSSKDKVLQLDPNRLTLDHFEKLRVIGKGAFGKVHAVSRRDTKVLYAMKVLDKQEIVNQRMGQNVLNERFILAALNYPLIVNLRCALQSPLDLFMIVDLMQGGDVRYHMRQDKRFTEERVKFYCAQTAMALNFLHSQGYVHRDIKPDNLLLDSQGNCHLTDFNLSVKLPEEGIRGIAGTRPYMAPEVLLKKLYSSEIDWWSFGVMLYEMMFWRLPFSGDADRLRYSILNEEPRFPKEADKHLLALVKGLLNKDPVERFGFKEVKASPWFKGLDWDKLETKEAPTPWQPDPNRANCDGSYDLDEQFEVKKKRYPLPAEQEAMFGPWDWQPGQKDEGFNIQPHDKEVGYDEEDHGDHSHSDGSESEEKPKPKKKKKGAAKKKPENNDSEGDEPEHASGSEKAEESADEAEKPKKKKGKKAKAAPAEEASEHSAKENGDASSAEHKGDAEEESAKATPKDDEAESAPEAAQPGKSETEASKEEKSGQEDEPEQPAKKPKKGKKAAAAAAASEEAPKKTKKKKAT